MISGSLTAGDQDWFTWSVEATALSYDLQLDAAGDAEVQMWKKQPGGKYFQIPNKSSTDITSVSSTAGQYFIAVYSPNGADQSYTLTLTK